MADETKDTSKPEGDKPKETVEPKLIAGKYKTVEAAEAALKESERKMHEATQRAATLERELANAKAPATKQGETPPEAQEEAVAQEMLTRPTSFLKRYGDGVIQQAVAQAQLYTETRLAIERFMVKNPEAETNPKLFKAFFQDAEGDNLEEKLGNALEQMKTHLGAAENKGKKSAEAERKARAKTSASPGAEDEGDAVAAGDEETDTPETSSSYLKERRKAQAKVKALV